MWDVSSNKTTNITTTNETNKWVINLSTNPITKAQESLLARGPNVIIVPRYNPKETYNAVIEEVCMKLPPWRQKS